MKIEPEKGMSKINNSNLEIAREDHINIIKTVENEITLLTSNKSRHNYLINFLSNYCKELYVCKKAQRFFQELNCHYKFETIKNYFLKATIKRFRTT